MDHILPFVYMLQLSISLIFVEKKKEKKKITGNWSDDVYIEIFLCNEPDVLWHFTMKSHVYFWDLSFSGFYRVDINSFQCLLAGGILFQQLMLSLRKAHWALKVCLKS